MLQRLMVGLFGSKQEELGQALGCNGRPPFDGSPLARLQRLIQLGAVALFALVVAPAFGAGINDTGVTAARDNNGNPTSCADDGAYPRQDACFGRDAQGSLSKIGGGSKGFDFTKINEKGENFDVSGGTWSCTRDNVTGLMWEVKTASQGLHSQNNTYSWYHNGAGAQGGGSCSGGTGCDTAKFVADVNAAGLCGSDGANAWRLPTVKELEGLVDYSVTLNIKTAAAIDSIYFPDTVIDKSHWTSESDVSVSGFAWAVDFLGGSVNRGNQYQSALPVRLVRGSQIHPVLELTTKDLNSGRQTTVTDASTGLMWKRDFEMLDPASPGDYLNRKDAFLWDATLQRSVADRTGGFSDWRVPSVKELHSIVDRRRNHSSMDLLFPGSTPGSYYWTSTPTYDYRSNPLVWMVGFDHGHDVIAPTYQTGYARLVRNIGNANPLGAFTLNMSIEGLGSLNVQSIQDPVSCGTVCSPSFYENTVVTIQAKPELGYSFAGWSGACSGIRPCTLTMSQAHSVAAKFALLPVGGFALTVRVIGPDLGAVVSNPAGINCRLSGTQCIKTTSDIVTLRATPDSGGRFVGWSDGICGGAFRTFPVCLVPMAEATEVAATFAPAYMLSVRTDGTGQGTVQNSLGVDCLSAPGACNTSGESVTLIVSERSGSTFAGWSGGCTGLAPCQLLMSSDQSVVATFNISAPVVDTPVTPPVVDTPVTPPVVNVSKLVVTVSGSGSGTVTSVPTGINCPGRCEVAGVAVVTLTAMPAAGSSFRNWAGVCQGSTVETCPVTIGSDSVLYSAAVFEKTTSGTDTGTPTTNTLSVTRQGTGSGTVISDVGGINCGPVSALCAATFASTASVTLSPMPIAGSSFTGWNGGGCTGAGTCQVSMAAARSITATFTASGTVSGVTLEVIKKGTGLGAVSSSPVGINCGSTCVMATTSATVVTLSAKAEAGYNFAGWSGGGCTGTGTCAVSMTSAQSVSATFTFGVAAGSTLTLSKTGSGTGTVSSLPILSCGEQCKEASASVSAPLTLTAVAGAGSYFVGWSEGQCAAALTCTVSLTQAKTVAATFALFPDSKTLFDGIYLWADGQYLSVHRSGSILIGTVYSVHGADNLKAEKLPLKEVNTFDLLQGRVDGTRATLAGTEFFRACKVSYELDFNPDSSITVRRTSVTNSEGVGAAVVSCAERYKAEATWIVNRSL